MLRRSELDKEKLKLIIGLYKSICFPAILPTLSLDVLEVSYE